MIILDIYDGAGPGNQMFMYAHAYALAKKYNQKIIIMSEISGYSSRQNILQYLDLDKSTVLKLIKFDWSNELYLCKVVSKFIRKLIFQDLLSIKCFVPITQETKRARIWESEIELKKGRIYRIRGYWESDKYFENCRNELIQQLRPNYYLDDEVKQFLNKVSSEDSLAIHIRKGDFADFGRLIDDQYYQSAIEYMMTYYPNSKPYILTEDDQVAKLWKEKYGAERIQFSTTTKYIDEWYVMSQCKYHIISNSTYSWWSSYISNQSGKVVLIPSENIYFRNKIKNHQEYCDYFRSSDVIIY